MNPSIYVVTGLSGAGKSSALKTLEDFGCEVIDNLPISLCTQLVQEKKVSTPLALGIDVRTRDFNIPLFLTCLAQLRQQAPNQVKILFFEAHAHAIETRYRESRRQHPQQTTAVLETAFKVIRQGQCVTEPLRRLAQCSEVKRDTTRRDARRDALSDVRAVMAECEETPRLVEDYKSDSEAEAEADESAASDESASEPGSSGEEDLTHDAPPATEAPPSSSVGAVKSSLPPADVAFLEVKSSFLFFAMCFLATDFKYRLCCNCKGDWTSGLHSCVNCSPASRRCGRRGSQATIV